DRDSRSSSKRRHAPAAARTWAAMGAAALTSRSLSARRQYSTPRASNRRVWPDYIEGNCIYSVPTGGRDERGRRVMDFGYFTLSDNHYENNPRTANQFVTDITEEALHADRLSMHSAWIGEHHFNSLGVLSSPELVLGHIAARTRHIRLAPAATGPPLHHPVPVAQQRGTRDRPRHRRPAVR